MGYSLQRPGKPDRRRKNVSTGAEKFQWATHFNAQANSTAFNFLILWILSIAIRPSFCFSPENCWQPAPMTLK